MLQKLVFHTPGVEHYTSITKMYWTDFQLHMLIAEMPVPNKPDGFCGRKTTLNTRNVDSIHLFCRPVRKDKRSGVVETRRPSVSAALSLLFHVWSFQLSCFINHSDWPATKHKLWTQSWLVNTILFIPKTVRPFNNTSWARKNVLLVDCFAREFHLSPLC